MELTQLTNIFESFNQMNVLIIGDVMIDGYVWGKVDRISPEAPVPVLSVAKKEDRLGGAANVALNIQSMGAKPILCSVIGDDENGKKFILPSNQEVILETTMDDIEWIKIDPINRVIVYNKPKPIQSPTTWEFESSSSPGQFYTVRLLGKTYKCNCPGVYRSKDRICKHIKEVQNGK
jgi:hypothetical protein